MSDKNKNACVLHAGKQKYNSGAATRRAIDNIREYGEAREKRPVRAYLCPGCSKHFLTSQPE